VHAARFVAIRPGAGNLRAGADISITDNAVRHPGAETRTAMEIAAILMFAAAILGLLQQFDRQVW